MGFLVAMFEQGNLEKWGCAAMHASIVNELVKSFKFVQIILGPGTLSGNIRLRSIIT